MRQYDDHVCFIHVSHTERSIYQPTTLGISEVPLSRSWPISSFLVYSPVRRREAWRFISYMFLHGGLEHIGFNCLMQLLVGMYLVIIIPQTHQHLFFPRHYCKYFKGKVLREVWTP